MRGLSADGRVAVGRSSGSLGSRAFRWTAASGLVDLGPGARAAHAISADGLRVVGEGSFLYGDSLYGDSAFAWDATHGARALAVVLRDDYGLDVGEFRLLSATAVSPDGKTIVGNGLDADGQPRAWRARLREEACRAAPVAIDLVDRHAESDVAIEIPASLGVDSIGRVSVSGNQSRNLWRIGTSLETLADPPIEHLLDFSSDPPDAWEVPGVRAVGADDSVYVTLYQHQQLLRFAADGTVQVVFDGSGYPPIPSETISGSFRTAPVDAALAPSGSLYISTEARLLRFDPDGSIHELIDAPAAQEAMIGYRDPLYLSLGWIEVTPQDRVFLATDYGLLLLDGHSGAVLEILDSLRSGIHGIKSSGRGGLWVYGDNLVHVNSNGLVHEVLGSPIPDGAEGLLPWIKAFTVDEDLNVYYAGETVDHSDVVVRRTPAGALTQVLAAYTRDRRDKLVGFFSASDLQISGGALFVADYLGNRVLRVELSGGRPTACTNGLDDDGDGLIDYPNDPGCLSPDDEGEHSFERPCDNGIDDDHDGAIDFPADPGCVSLTASREATECDDGIDNDGDGAIDWNGAGLGPPDPECAGDPRRVIEHPMFCGLGFEVAIVVLPLTQALRRWRRRLHGGR